MMKKTAFLSGIICLLAIKNIYCINIYITLIQEYTYYVNSLHKYFLHSQKNNYQFLLYFDKLYIKPTNMEKKKFLIDEYLQGRPDVRFFKHIMFRFSVYLKNRKRGNFGTTKMLLKKNQGITIK